jgi:hypothetical protein
MGIIDSRRIQNRTGTDDIIRVYDIETLGNVLALKNTGAVEYKFTTKNLMASFHIRTKRNIVAFSDICA